MREYCMYIRKSRADEPDEALERHRKTLQELADRLGLRVTRVYQEVASADSIAGRKEIKALLNDVCAGMWAGVLVMDLDRLGRGDSADQAVIMTNFLYSDTQIITPSKTYDLADEMDQDQSEFRLMFARLEYKQIKRRLYRGRERSARDGWYLGTKHPFGYRKIKTTGPTLEIIPEQAALVRLMFEQYAAGLGKETICDLLNATGARTNSGALWTPSSVGSILHNPLYVGKVRWGRRVGKPVYTNGIKEIKRPINPDMIVADGQHEAIVPDSLWEAVQARLQGNPAPSIKAGKTVSNPLCGLVKCARCGRIMQRHYSAPDSKHRNFTEYLRCPNRSCDQYHVQLDVIEAAILEHLRALTVPTVDADDDRIKRAELRAAEANATRKSIAETESQLERAHDFLERGIYSLDDFLRRRESLSERLAGLHTRLAEYTRPDPEEERLAALRRLVPAAQSALELYSRAGTPEARNELLKSVIDHVLYNRTERSWRNTDPAAGLEITIFPALKL